MNILTVVTTAHRAVRTATLLSVVVGAALLAGCEAGSVDPAIASMGTQVLDGSVPNDLDRFAIKGDLHGVANCQGHVRESARASYGDSMDLWGGNVQNYTPRDQPLRFTAVRDGGNHWRIESADFTASDADKDAFEKQVNDCAGVLLFKMNRALHRQEAQERDRTSWFIPSVGATPHAPS